MGARALSANVAIVTTSIRARATLVDAIRQSGAFRENQDLGERIMDTGDLEREKGITILAKNTAVGFFAGRRSSIIDTRPCGLARRARPDSCWWTPAKAFSQTRFVLRKALESQLPVILVVNKVDRPDARIAKVPSTRCMSSSLDLDANKSQIEFPIVYSNAHRATPPTPTRSPTISSRSST